MNLVFKSFFLFSFFLISAMQGVPPSKQQCIEEAPNKAIVHQVPPLTALCCDVIAESCKKEVLKVPPQTLNLKEVLSESYVPIEHQLSIGVKFFKKTFTTYNHPYMDKIIPYFRNSFFGSNTEESCELFINMFPPEEMAQILETHIVKFDKNFKDSSTTLKTFVRKFLSAGLPPHYNFAVISYLLFEKGDEMQTLSIDSKLKIASILPVCISKRYKPFFDSYILQLMYVNDMSKSLLSFDCSMHLDPFLIAASLDDSELFNIFYALGFNPDKKYKSIDSYSTIEEILPRLNYFSHALEGPEKGQRIISFFENKKIELLKKD